jgi:hypothetical protein
LRETRRQAATDALSIGTVTNLGTASGAKPSAGYHHPHLVISTGARIAKGKTGVVERSAFYNCH